jgi:hypothetical protein
MNTPRWHIGLLLLLCLAASTAAQAQPTQQQTVGPLPIQVASEHAQAFMDRMVRILARGLPGKSPTAGYGFVVGDHATADGQPGYLIVTADHLVRDPANPAQRFPPPQVIFNVDLAKVIPAELLEQHLPPQQGDVAALVVPKSSIPQPQPAQMGDTQALLPGMATWQLGLPGTWRLANANARFALREPTGWLNFDGLEASQASVGGAVVNELGLVGMVVGRPSANAPVRVVPVELMANKFREWGMAWNLSGAPSPTVAATSQPSGAGGNQASNAPASVAPSGPPPNPSRSIAPGSNEFGSLTIVAMLPAELATRGSWVPPGARVSPWLRSGATLWGAPRRDANRVGALPAGYLLPEELWARGAYDIQSRIDKGAWFLLGNGGQPMGYVAGTDVVEVWPAAKSGTPPDGKVVREFPLKGGKAVLRDAGSHFDLDVSLTCGLAVCDSILIFTPIPPSPGAIVPTFQVPAINGTWQQNDVVEVHFPLPRSLVDTKGTELVTCFGLETACQQQRVPIGG